MNQPNRIQRQRTLGWRMPLGAVYVGRPTRWGNPYRVGYDFIETADEAVEIFRNMLKYGNPEDYPSEAEIRLWLRGKNLVCWCAPDQPCHADVLLELANKGGM